MRLKSILSAVAVLTLAAWLGGCSLLPERGERARDNEFLNDGYSLLYSAAWGLRYSNDLLKIKFENDHFQAVIEQVSAFSDQLVQDLDRVSRDYPAVKTDLSPLPEMEARKRAAVNKDRLLSLAPVVGRTGPAFERTLLLSSSGALNQTRFLCQVLAEREPEPALRQLLLETEQELAELYDQVVVLLNQAYFTHNTYVPPER